MLRLGCSVRSCLHQSEIFYTILHIVLAIGFVHPDEKTQPCSYGFAILSHPDDDTCVLKTGFCKIDIVVAIVQRTQPAVDARPRWLSSDRPRNSNSFL